MPALRPALFLSGLLVFAACPGRADVGPPVTITLEGDPAPAETGVLYEGTFRVLAHQTFDLTSMYLVEDGNWFPQYLAAPPVGTPLIQDEFVLVAFGVEVLDPDLTALGLVVGLNGVEYPFAFSLSPTAFVEGDTEQPLITVSEVSGNGPRASGRQAGPRFIRVHGRCVYTMPNIVDVPAAGMTITIYDTNNSWIFGDQALVTGTTNNNGEYDLVFFWPAFFESDPDIKVIWRSENPRVSVRNTVNKVLTWYTPTWNDFQGTDLDVGIMKPAALTHQVYLHLLTVLERAWHWVQSDLGLSVTQVKAFRDDSNGPAYEAGQDLIHMNGDAAWNTGRIWDEVTIVHEFGHHVIDNHGVGLGSGYCNSPCETCSKCKCSNNGPWGEEQNIDAWNEGFPTWMGLMVTARQSTLYGLPVVTTFDMESLSAGSVCGGSAVFGDPTRTEGPFVAFLNDVVDAANEDDPATPGFADVLTWPSSRIWEVMWLDQPTTPLDFLGDLVARNFADRGDIWETARNNSYEIDLLKPAAITTWSSSSHTVGVTSTDGTVELNWIVPFDDMSGIAGYGVSIVGSGPQLPPATMTLGDLLTYTTPQLAPGNHWVNFRALDRSGKWSDAFTSMGPFTIAEPLTANISAQSPQGWTHVLVPQPVGNSSPAGVDVPATLEGGGPTWWNLGFVNSGTGTSSSTENVLLIDGIASGSVAAGAIRPGETFTAVNLGPIAVPGGRHAFECWLDAAEQMSEGLEGDNFWARQWLWSAVVLPEGAREVQPAPPDRTAGWSSIVGDPLLFNLSGHRIVAAPGFRAVAVHARDDSDYDLELHDPAGGPLSGFDSYLGWSARVGGELDALVLHNGLAVDREYDVGLTNYSGGSGELIIEHVASQPLDFGTTAELVFDHDAMLALRTVDIATENTGRISVCVQMDPADGRLWAAWRDADFTVSGLFSGTITRTDGLGRARMDLFVDRPGTYVLTVWRDPRDGTQPRVVEVEVVPTAPDIAPYVAPGWAAALVPRPAADGTPSDVPAPTELEGDLSPTYFNVAVTNSSPTPMPASDTELFVDQTSIGHLSWPSLPAGGGWDVLNSAAPAVVRGGRHTVWAAHDATYAATELDELDNLVGGQWVWTPQIVFPPNPIVRSAPPDPIAGWSTLTSPAELWFNADGIRMRVLPDARSRVGMWAAAAVVPGPTSDFDLQLHEASSSAQSGFEQGLVMSGWGAGESDFVLVNSNRTPARDFDVGVFRNFGGDDYWVHTAESHYLGIDPAGTHGPFALAAGRLVDLHEMWLDPGVYVVHLRSEGAPVDYGMTLHPGNVPYLSKSTRMPGAMAWMAGPGEDEWITFRVDVGRDYCLSVWKRGHSDVLKNGSYRIEIQTGLTATEPAPPVRSIALIDVTPNPFNPVTSISFDVGVAQVVDVSVFSLDGRRVIRLLHDPLPVGLHSIHWNGLDDRARAVASGVYFVRLSGEKGEVDQLSVTLVK